MWIAGNVRVLPPGLPIVRFDNVPEWKNTGYLRLRGNIGGVIFSPLWAAAIGLIGFPSAAAAIACAPISFPTI